MFARVITKINMTRFYGPQCISGLPPDSMRNRNTGIT